jgi:PKD domain
MPTRKIAAALVIGALSASTVAAQSSVEIEHKAVGCIVVGKYPKMNACFTPAPNLARGRVYFRPEGTTSWYYVDMKSDAPCYAGVLPKPGKKLVGKKIEYYVEGQDKTFNAARTAEFGPVVVNSAQECKKEVPVAPFLNNATVAVFPSLPAGFAAGSAIGTGAVLGIVGAGAAAAGTAVVVANHNNDNTTTTIAVSNNTTTTVAAATTTTTTTSTTTTLVGTNHAPNAILKVSPEPPTGTTPLTVIFDLCGSTDPDHDPLSYFFDFGDGGHATGACSVSHVYTASSFRARSGDVRAQSTTYNFNGSVVDPGGLSLSRARNVVVNVPTTTTPPCPTPTATITIPAGTFISGCPNVGFSADTTNTDSLMFCSQPIDPAICSALGVRDPASVGVFAAPSAPTCFSASGSGGTFTGTVNFPGSGCYGVTAQASNTCGGSATSAQKIISFFDSCGFRVKGDGATALFTSDLHADRGRLQMVVNGRDASFPASGRSYGAARVNAGENRVEATVVDALDKAGTWTVEIAASETIVSGSIRVLAGNAQSVGPTSVTFLLKGTPGERVAFTFQKK